MIYGTFFGRAIYSEFLDNILIWSVLYWYSGEAKHLLAMHIIFLNFKQQFYFLKKISTHLGTIGQAYCIKLLHFLLILS